MNLHSTLREFLKTTPHSGTVSHQIIEENDRGSYREVLIQYPSNDGDNIPAYLLIPKGDGFRSAVLIHHQHNGERHLGKSEVVGKAGNPFQALGPALAEKGVLVLAPDSVCFEDRRPNAKGITRDDEGDWLQHFNEMTYRLIAGDTLMRKVLDDASVSLSLLLNFPGVSPDRVGVLGHSYGGNTALFQAATDQRIRFVCSSGALCSYQNKIEHQTGLEMALAIPSFCKQFEMDDVVQAISPRPLLIVSATEDKYSKDADKIVSSCQKHFSKDALTHYRYNGGHALTQDRFDAIINWLAERCK